MKSPGWKRSVFLCAKILVAVVVVAWLFHKVDVSLLWNTVRTAELRSVFSGLLLALLTVVIASWRWQRLLSVFRISVPLKSLMCVTQIGQFFTMFLPGSSGDDLTRMLYISRAANGRVTEACTTVVIDRCIGLASILVLATFCVPWQWRFLATTRQTRWLALGILIAGIAVCVFGVIFFISGRPTQRWFQGRLSSLPTHVFRDELARIWGRLCANKRPVAQVASAAIVTQLVLCVVFYLAGRAVGIEISLFAWMSFVPITLAANAVPITIAGLGVREYLVVLFLKVLAQVESERALAASFIVFAITVAVCLLGGLVYVFYRPKRKSNALTESSESAA